ncbi:hypothetical protein V6N13_020344 [Hibiscus sabdariffa]
MDQQQRYWTKEASRIRIGYRYRYVNEMNKKRMRKREEITEAIIDEIVKGVAIAVVRELVVGSREFLETLRSYGV